MYNTEVAPLRVVIDTSAVTAVLASEPERGAVVRATEGVELVAPASVHWEVGNALSAILKRRRTTSEGIQRALRAYATIPIRFVDVELDAALAIAAEHDLYAYDAYLITCALGQRLPLLTLDESQARAAVRAGVAIKEIPK